jgi:hypothetical protein
MLNIQVPEDYYHVFQVELMRVTEPLFPNVVTLQTGLNSIGLDWAVLWDCPGVKHLVMCIEKLVWQESENEEATLLDEDDVESIAESSEESCKD